MAAPMPPLFFYGVLMPELATGRMAELVALLGPGQPASVAGTLYAVPDPAGHHPAMTPGQGLVHGRLHLPSPRFGAAELAEMDAYEGAAYARHPVQARLADGSTLPAEAYVFLEATGGLALIPHGDFARYLAETGAAALPG